MVISDYPDLYTNAMMKYQAGAYDFYDETVISMISNKSLVADWTYDAKTWKTDWKTKVLGVSGAMKTAWDSYVDSFNNSYYGSLMQQEYNEAVQSGNMVKVGNKTS